MQILNYYFIDGSALLAQIRELQKKRKIFIDRRLDVVFFIRQLMGMMHDLHGGVYKRAVFYFPKGDEEFLKKYLVLPDFKKPGLVRDIEIKFCGQKLKGTEAFRKFVDEQVPSRYKGRFTKSEKGVDIEICCDILKLSSTGKIDRLFLLTNDSDFVALCKTVKEFGSNVSLLALSDIKAPNDELLHIMDSFDTLSDTALQQVFVPAAV